MARVKAKDVRIDNELLYAYARTDRMADLEDFLAASNIAKVQDVGDIFFNEGLYQAARVAFTHVNNQAKLAITLVRLRLYAEAVDAARKANNILTWKEVCFSCVLAGEFRLAQMCAMHIIVYMDHLLDLVRHYERGGHFSELIGVLEQGINLERAHQGMYTQLGVLYAKYKEEKLMEHIKLFWSRLNIPTLLVACQQNLHWHEAVFLYTHYDQYDNAIATMIDHSAECWKHSLFKEILLQVSNTEIYYRALTFYLSEHPLLLNDLLLDLSGKLDHARVVDIVQRVDHVPLIEKYLLHVQRDNIANVNEASSTGWRRVLARSSNNSCNGDGTSPSVVMTLYSSSSADTHKYGYAPKGASVVMYSSSELRAYQYFVATEWTGGIYASPSMPGSRPGGLIAATWAALVVMGEAGYMECAREIMHTAKAIEAGLRAIPGIRVVGTPHLSVVSFAADESTLVRGQRVNIYKVGEALTATKVDSDGVSRGGWNLNTLQKPSAIHICCTYMHRGRAQQFLEDVRAAVDMVVDNPQMFKNGSAAIYGLAEALPDGSLIEDMARGFIDTLYLTEK